MGGRVIPLDNLAAMRAVADRHGLAMHLDGARIFNASVALDVDVRTISGHFDSVAFCLSKGLGAPVGSLIVGTREHMERCWVLRKQMGGGMRQSGLLAAAGLWGLDHNLGRLAADHVHARLLAERLAAVPGVRVDLEATQTNIVVFGVEGTGQSAADIVAAAEKRGVRVVLFGRDTLRAVTHLDVDRAAVERAADVLAELLGARAGSASG
jgi:threonine aldolase